MLTGHRLTPGVEWRMRSALMVLDGWPPGSCEETGGHLFLRGALNHVKAASRTRGTRGRVAQPGLTLVQPVQGDHVLSGQAISVEAPTICPFSAGRGRALGRRRRKRRSRFDRGGVRGRSGRVGAGGSGREVAAGGAGVGAGRGTLSLTINLRPSEHRRKNQNTCPFVGRESPSTSTWSMP